MEPHTDTDLRTNNDVNMKNHSLKCESIELVLSEIYILLVRMQLLIRNFADFDKYCLKGNPKAHFNNVI